MASLTISFTPPNPVPDNGYVVQYRKVGDATYQTLSPNPTTAPVVIPNVSLGVAYEGSIQSSCTNGSAAAVNFTASAKGFQLSSSYNTAFTSLSGTGLPAFSFPTATSGNVTQPMIGTIPAQTISVGISLPATTIHIDLLVDGVVVSTVAGITTAGTYNLTFPNPVAISSFVSIQINI